MARFKAIRKSGHGYKVIAKSTGKPLSKHPLSHKKALAQLGAVEAHKHAGAMHRHPTYRRK